jgi:cyclase
MLIPRIIPVMLINKGRAYVSVKAKKFIYVGDPINSIKIFNEKGIDELVILNIDKEKTIDFDYLKQLSTESLFPVGYGGGITNLEQIKKVVSLGFEKVVLNSVLEKNANLIRLAAEEIGSQSVVISADYRNPFWGEPKVYFNLKKSDKNLILFCKEMEERGAGEIILHNLDKESTFSGYDLQVLNKVSNNVKIPVIPIGGALTHNHFIEGFNLGAHAVAAGSTFFLNKGNHNSILISYPSEKEKDAIFAHKV